MNDTEIGRIAAATNALRPDWPLESLRTFIATKLATRARRDVAVALAYVACESDTVTPARVLSPGPWWKVGDQTAPRNARSDQLMCFVCGLTEEQCGARERLSDHVFQPRIPVAPDDVRGGPTYPRRPRLRSPWNPSGQGTTPPTPPADEAATEPTTHAEPPDTAHPTARQGSEIEERHE
jgi:hypothetical protein